MAKKLSDFARIRLGYKSLQNDFFYVNKETIDRFRIESQYLVPVLRLRDLDHKAYFQNVTPKVWVFYCKEEPADLRGTGASRYIEWGRLQTTKPRKQSEKPVRFPDAPALQSQKHWYWPAAPLHKTKIAVRKGISEIYAPFLFKSPAVVDQRCQLVTPDGVTNELLSAYLASSLFALALETNADLGLGEGVLTLATTSLRSLPTIDLSSIGAKDAKLIDQAFQALAATTPPTAKGLSKNDKQRQLDSAFLKALGLQESQVGELHEGVRMLSFARTSKAGRRASMRAVGEKANIAAVIENVATSLGAWLQIRRFPEGFSNTAGGPKLTFTDRPLEVTMQPFLGSCNVTVESDRGKEYEETISIEQAEVLLRALQMGRRKLTLPATDAECRSALKAFQAFLDEFEGELIDKFADVGLGERHRDAVYGGVLNKVNMPLDSLRDPFEGGNFKL